MTNGTPPRVTVLPGEVPDSRDPDGADGAAGRFGGLGRVAGLDGVGWAAWSLLSTAATSWLLVVCSLIGWSLAPMVIGWHPTLVVTGSLSPRIDPGDVVLFARPGSAPERGQVVLLSDPYTATGRVVHRIVRVEADGRFRTKGDANPSMDSELHTTEELLGVGRLVVPAAGRLALLQHGRADESARLWLIVTGLAALVFVVSRAGQRPEES